MNREAVAGSCEQQAAVAAKLGSPMSEGLLRRIGDDVRSGGPCLAALEPDMERTRGLASQLLLAAVHKLVLLGQVPEAERFYPSMGGRVDLDGLWPHFVAAVPLATLPMNVQMNDARRTLALLPGFVVVARQTGKPLRLLEIGASAGLNLRWDHFSFVQAPEDVRVVERRGCDLAPIDAGSDEGRASLLCFIWADQTERLTELARAIDVARQVPAVVDRADAVPWLEDQLAERRAGVATLVFHSVFWPYLSEDARTKLRDVLEAAGRRATDEAPLAWLSMEPGAAGADIHLAMWPGGERRLIAQSDFECRNVKVL